jgi:hypothetical protein
MSDFETRVAQYVQLRDLIKEEEKAFKEAMAPKREMLEVLGNLLLHMLKATRQNAANTSTGTVYKITKKAATISDAALFRRHVIDNELWELADWKANPTAVADVVEKTNLPPPGVNYSTVLDVGVRRPNGKA